MGKKYRLRKNRRILCFPTNTICSQISEKNQIEELNFTRCIILYKGKEKDIKKEKE